MAPQGAGCPALRVHGPAPAEVQGQGAGKAEHFPPPGMCSQPRNSCTDGLHLRVFRNIPPQVLGKAKKISGSASKNIS